VSQSTIEKIRAARALRVTVKHMTFIGRRPTVAEFGQHIADKTPDPEVARAAITGWDGVRECDLIDGGSEDPIAFDQALWDEALPDHPEIWTEVMLALTNAVVTAMTRSEESKKN